jgi:glyoxylate/hydroxypyruvate reductase A
MNILFHASFANQDEFLKSLRKKFFSHKIFTLDQNVPLDKIEVALVWNLPDKILKKLKNLKIIFSLGAGVDHILKLPSYKNTPIIRIQDPNMRSRMLNHVLAQILIYQLKLTEYNKAQQKNIWLDERHTSLNKDLTIGVLGVGYLGKFIANKLKSLNYNVIGYKNTISAAKYSIPIYYKKSLKTFLKLSDIIVSVLPATKETRDLINKSFLNQMKKKSLLINIGRGSSLNEMDLLKHIKQNNYFFASLDVFKKEPLPKNSKLWKNQNITVTPHVAAITDVDSSINYIFSKFEQFRTNGKIKSDVKIKNGY